MFPWQPFWQSTLYSAKKYSYRNYALMYLPSRISKLTAQTQACGHFQVTYLVLPQPPLALAAGCSGQVPSHMSFLYSQELGWGRGGCRWARWVANVQTLGSNFFIQFR